MARNGRRRFGYRYGMMPVKVAGRLGGEKTARRHGRGFFRRIGRKGGLAGRRRR